MGRLRCCWPKNCTIHSIYQELKEQLWLWKPVIQKCRIHDDSHSYWTSNYRDHKNCSTFFTLYPVYWRTNIQCAVIAGPANKLPHSAVGVDSLLGQRWRDLIKFSDNFYLFYERVTQQWRHSVAAWRQRRWWWRVCTCLSGRGRPVAVARASTRTERCCWRSLETAARSSWKCPVLAYQWSAANDRSSSDPPCWSSCGLECTCCTSAGWTSWKWSRAQCHVLTSKQRGVCSNGVCSRHCHTPTSSNRSSLSQIVLRSSDSNTLQ